MRHLNLFQYVASLFAPLALGLGLSLMMLTGMALAHEGQETASLPSIPPNAWQKLLLTPTTAITTDFSFVRDIPYARIISDKPVRVYSHPLDLERGIPPTRTIQPGFMFVSLEREEPLTLSNGIWYEINQNEFVQAEVLTRYYASTFKGVELLTQLKRPFGWIIRSTPIFSAPVDAPTPTDLLGWPVARQMAAPA